MKRLFGLLLIKQNECILSLAFFKGKGWNIEICSKYVSIPFFNDANQDNIITVSPMTNRPEKEIRIIKKSELFFSPSLLLFITH